MSQAGRRLATAAAIVVRDDMPAEACDAYIAAHACGLSYHRPRWNAVIHSAFGHDTKYLAAEIDGAVAGVLPLVFFRSRVFGRFAVSMPFLNYGGVLADGPAVERALLERAIEEAKVAGASHLELRHTGQHFDQLTPKRHKVAMELALASTVDAQWQALDRKLRNQVRKAEKSGLSVQRGGAELLPKFYEVFARNMRDLGTPVYGARFFREVLDAFPSHSRLFVVSLKDRAVAGSLVHWYGSKVEVPWASALREFNPLCANVYLYWEMVKFAVEQGFRTFDFGRSTPGEGTYQFKKQWGAEARELVWEYWTAPGQRVPDLSPKNARFDLPIRVWKKLPVRVATAVGPLIVRNIP